MQMTAPFVFSDRAVSMTVLSVSDTRWPDLAEATLVDEIAHALQAGVAVHDVRVDLDEVVHRGLVDTHEDAVVDLQQPEHLHDVARFRVHPVDTAQAHHKEQLRLRLNVEGALLASSTLHCHELLLLRLVLRHVLLSALEGLLLAGLSLGRGGSGSGLGSLIPLLLALALLQHVLRNGRCSGGLLLRT